MSEAGILREEGELDEVQGVTLIGDSVSFGKDTIFQLGTDAAPNRIWYKELG